MLISSRQNDIVKRAASLKQKKNRYLYGEYLVEGEKLVAEAFSTEQTVVSVYATQNKAEFARDLIENFLKSESKKKASKTSPELFILSESAFEYISDEVTPQGVAAAVKINENPPIGRLSPSLLLDRLQDPGNVGAILRLAAACGISDVFLISCADPYSPKAVRSSMSGLFRLNVHLITEEEAIKLFKDNEVSLICADMNGDNVFTSEVPQSFCLCVGNEGNGISENIKQAADKTFRIPMQNGVESLNVGIAAGVALYTMMNNRKGV